MRWRQLIDGLRSELVTLCLSTDEDDVELLKMSPFTTLLTESETSKVIRHSKQRKADVP